MDKEKKFYQPPEEMPGGFWDVLQLLATWILRALKDAYQNGYYAGKADSSRTWLASLGRISPGSSPRRSGRVAGRLEGGGRIPA